MSPVEIQKEIIKLGGIREIYKSCRDVDSIFGKKKSQVLRDIVRIACYSYNIEEPKIKELLENIKSIEFDENGDYKEKFIEMYNDNCSYSEIAKEFEVSEATIFRKTQTLIKSKEIKKRERMWKNGYTNKNKK